MDHKNSQKRFYVEGYTYFVTGITKNRYRYFEEEIFCTVFWEKLQLCAQLKRFILHGWFLGYDHFHLLITSTSKANISEIMRSLKTNTSRAINQILEGEVCRPRLQNGNHEKYQSEIDSHFSKLKSLQFQFHQKHPISELSFPRFMWQRSFHDHVIRDERDFETHLRYIQYNPIKHEMPEGWRWWGI